MSVRDNPEAALQIDRPSIRESDPLVFDVDADVSGFDWGDLGKNLFGGLQTVAKAVPIVSTLADKLQPLEQQAGILPDWAKDPAADVQKGAAAADQKGAARNGALSAVVVNPDAVIVMKLSPSGKPIGVRFDQVSKVMVQGGKRVVGSPDYKKGDTSGLFSFGYENPVSVEIVDKAGKKTSGNDVKQILFLGGSELTAMQGVGDMLDDFFGDGPDATAAYKSGYNDAKNGFPRPTGNGVDYYHGYDDAVKAMKVKAVLGDDAIDVPADDLEWHSIEGDVVGDWEEIVDSHPQPDGDRIDIPEDEDAWVEVNGDAVGELRGGGGVFDVPDDGDDDMSWEQIVGDAIARPDSPTPQVVSRPSGKPVLRVENPAIVQVCYRIQGVGLLRVFQTKSSTQANFINPKVVEIYGGKRQHDNKGYRCISSKQEDITVCIDGTCYHGYAVYVKGGKEDRTMAAAAAVLGALYSLGTDILLGASGGKPTKPSGKPQPHPVATTHKKAMTKVVRAGGAQAHHKAAVQRAEDSVKAAANAAKSLSAASKKVVTTKVRGDDDTWWSGDGSRETFRPTTPTTPEKRLDYNDGFADGRNAQSSRSNYPDYSKGYAAGVRAANAANGIHGVGALPKRVDPKKAAKAAASKKKAEAAAAQLAKAQERQKRAAASAAKVSQLVSSFVGKAKPQVATQKSQLAAIANKKIKTILAGSGAGFEEIMGQLESLVGDQYDDGSIDWGGAQASDSGTPPPADSTSGSGTLVTDPAAPASSTSYNPATDPNAPKLADFESNSPADPTSGTYDPAQDPNSPRYGATYDQANGGRSSKVPDKDDGSINTGSVPPDAVKYDGRWGFPSNGFVSWNLVNGGGDGFFWESGEWKEIRNGVAPFLNKDVPGADNAYGQQFGWGALIGNPTTTGNSGFTKGLKLAQKDNVWYWPAGQAPDWATKDADDTVRAANKIANNANYQAALAKYVADQKVLADMAAQKALSDAQYAAKQAKQDQDNALAASDATAKAGVAQTQMNVQAQQAMLEEAKAQGQLRAQAAQQMLEKKKGQGDLDIKAQQLLLQQAEQELAAPGSGAPAAAPDGDGSDGGDSGDGGGEGDPGSNVDWGQQNARDQIDDEREGSPEDMMGHGLSRGVDSSSVEKPIWLNG